jgi:AcrR family transcriptional regulator
VPKSLSQSEIDDFRARLISVAERLFAEQGREAVSMRQLAQALGVSVMTPYRYFKDKDDILAATRALGFDRFAEALETAYDSVDDPVQRARMVGAAYLKFAFENPSAYRLMFDLTQPNEENYPELARAGERARKTMSAYVESLLRAGQLVGDPEIVAHVCWAAIHGLVVLKLADKIAPHISFDRLWQEMSRALNIGLGPQDRLTAAA